MSEDPKHSPGWRVEPNFCSLRSNCCPCKNDYRAPCVDEMARWSALSSDLTGDADAWKFKKLVGRAQQLQAWGGQAHHALCVASVTKEITKVEEIKPTLEVTVWCVNKADNMIALPVWPMTINWYGKFAKSSGGDVTWAALVANTPRPPFKALAQHDYDHNLYNERLNKSLEEITKNVKRSKKKHEETSADLVASLERKRKRQLVSMQGRTTHEGWFNGFLGKPDWYKPFSMVESGQTERAFPAVGDENWEGSFKGLVKVFTKLGIG
jgi:hypothetical protein